MYKFSLIVLLSISFLFVVAQDKGNEPAAYRNSISINPIRFTTSTFQMSYDRLIGKDKSINISAGLTYKDNESESVSGYRGEFQLRYYVLQHETARVSRKIYAAPFVFDQYTDVTDKNRYSYDPYGNGTLQSDYRYNVNSFGAGFVMGLKWIFAKRFVLDGFVGGGVRTSNRNNSSSAYIDNSLMGYGYKGIFPRIGVDIGFTF
jgi:hypothetical protein